MDFPSSPTALRTFQKSGDIGVRLADPEVEGESGQGESEDTEYTAIASPPTGKVMLRKGEFCILI